MDRSSRTPQTPMAAAFAKFTVLFSVLFVCFQLPKLRADVVTEWNGLMLDAIRADATSPVLASRNLAILHAAIHDAIAGLDCDHETYRPQIPAPVHASAEAAAAGAAFQVLADLYPSRQVVYDDSLAKITAVGLSQATCEAGVVYGREVAKAILTWRANDLSSGSVPYIVRTNAGQWQRTPPHFRPPESPHWWLITPF